MEYHLKTPIKEEEIRKLKVGDIIYVSGSVITARDAAHVRAIDYHSTGAKIPISFKDLVLYHCGPLVKKVGDEWRVVSAGPTTSTRMEYIEHKFIEIFRPRVIVGKGGMGEKTTEALKKFGGVYTVFPGGVGVLAARAIKKIIGVEWLDLGVPEALWIFEVENFGPLIVAIDSHGNNLYSEIMKNVRSNLNVVLSSL